MNGRTRAHLKHGCAQHMHRVGHSKQGNTVMLSPCSLAAIISGKVARLQSMKHGRARSPQTVLTGKYGRARDSETTLNLERL